MKEQQRIKERMDTMYCKKCGAQNQEQAKFCEKCGTPLDEVRRNTGAADAEPTAANPSLTLVQRHKKQLMLGTVLLVVLIGCIVGFVIYSSSQKQADYQGKLQTANKYLQELDYEKAEAAYLEAIEIRPKKEDAYLELSSLYERQGEYEKAEKTLKKGKKKASGPKMEKAEKELAETVAVSNVYYPYLKEELVPDLGESSAEYEFRAWPEAYYYGWASPGIISVYMCDLNGDGRKEFLVLSCKTMEESNEREELCVGNEVHALCLSVYSMENEMVTLSDEIVLTAPFDSIRWDASLSIATATDGKKLIVYQKTDYALEDMEQEFLAFGFTKEGEFEGKVDLLGGQGYWTELRGSMGDDLVNLKKRDTYKERRSLPCLYWYSFEEDQAGGIYDSYLEGVETEFDKVGIPVSVTDNYLDASELDYEIEFQIKSEDAFKLMEMHADYRYETGELTAAITDNTNYASHMVDENSDVSGTSQAQCQAYYDLCMEYQEKYGKPGLEESFDENRVGLTGLCVAKLVDFNNDGNEELLLGYQDSNNRYSSNGYACEVWTWEDGKAVNVLPPTPLCCGQDLSRWIETAMDEKATYLIVDSAGDSIKYLQYENGKFNTKYEFEMGFAEDSNGYFAYYVNGKEFGSYEEAVAEMEKSFPQRIKDGYENISNDATYQSSNPPFRIYLGYAPVAYAEALIDDTENTMKELNP